MKFTPGAVISQASGSTGGTTYSRNRYGAYIRNRAIPVQPESQPQVNARNRMTQLVTRWLATLTTAQRAAWTLYGQNVGLQDSFGGTIYIPGKEHYIRSNVIRMISGASTIDDGPTTFALPAHDGSVYITASEAAQHIIVNWSGAPPWEGVAGAALLVYQGRPQNVTKNFYNGPWRFAAPIWGNAVPPTSPQNVDAVIPFVAGQKVPCMFRVTLEDGRLSTPFLYSCTAGA